jgi:RimJ/RimL family protein N-acetyltransferase
MRLIKNSYIYWEFIRTLRNMDGVRQGFIEQEYISQNQHESYMKKNSNFFYVCLDKTTPIGYIGVIENDIRVATHPDHQGKGIASFMLNEVMKIHPNAFAKVKIQNEASLRLFESCGFTKKYYVLERN